MSRIAKNPYFCFSIYGINLFLSLNIYPKNMDMIKPGDRAIANAVGQRAAAARTEEPGINLPKRAVNTESPKPTQAAEVSESSKFTGFERP